jgi:hypothetical protein
MDAWEYLTFNIELKSFGHFGSRSWEYTHQSPDGVQIKGIQDILTHYGSHGWELVNLIPMYWEGTTTTSAAHNLQAVFKRQKM